MANWAWTQSVLPLRARTRVLLSLTSRAPLAHPRHVVTVHDLFPLTHPEWYSRRYLRVHAPLLERLLKTSAGVIVVSEPVEKQIREQALCPDETPIVVAPNAPTLSLLTPQGVDSEPEPSRRPAGKYFVAVGTINDPRKNLARVLEAYGQLPGQVRSQAPLLVVGSAAPEVFSAASLTDSSGVQVLGYVSDSELRELYGGEAILISASLDEGFGLPLVEAHAAGCQLLISNIPVYRWVCGDAACYFDPYDVVSIRDAMLKSFESGGPAQQLPRPYSWDSTAKKVLSLLDLIDKTT
jgi:glycosyltransferase involved in cell wall biosynthesis